MPAALSDFCGAACSALVALACACCPRVDSSTVSPRVASPRCALPMPAGLGSPPGLPSTRTVPFPSHFHARANSSVPLVAAPTLSDYEWQRVGAWMMAPFVDTPTAPLGTHWDCACSHSSARGLAVSASMRTATAHSATAGTAHERIRTLIDRSHTRPAQPAVSWTGDHLSRSASIRAASRPPQP